MTRATAASQQRTLTISGSTQGILVDVVTDDNKGGHELSQILMSHGLLVRRFTLPRHHCEALACPDERYPTMAIYDARALGTTIEPAVLAATVRQCRSLNVTVIALTSASDMQSTVYALQTGITHCIPVPFSSSRLVEAVFSMLGTSEVNEPQDRALFVSTRPREVQPQLDQLRACGTDVELLDNTTHLLKSVEDLQPHVIVLDDSGHDVHTNNILAVLRSSVMHRRIPVLLLKPNGDHHSELQGEDRADEYLVEQVTAKFLCTAVKTRARQFQENTTIQHQLRTALYEREREHQALNHHAIVSVADASGRITYVNDRFCEISGYNRTELLGQNHRIVKSDRHSTDFYKDIWGTIAAGRVWKGEICNRRKDGSYYWVESTITPFVGEQGRPYQYVSIRTDITHVKAVEEAQREQNAIREMIGESAAELLSASETQLDLVIEKCLKRAAEHLGAERAYVLQAAEAGLFVICSHEWSTPETSTCWRGQPNVTKAQLSPWKSLMPQGDMVNIPDLKACIDSSIDEIFDLLGERVRSLCAIPMRRAGTIVGFLGFAQVSTVRDWDNPTVKLLGLMAGLIDSALLRTFGEKTLAQAAHRLNATLESTNDGILAVGCDGEVMFMNQQLREMWHIPDAPEYRGGKDGQLLAHATTLVRDPDSFAQKVATLNESSEESDDLIALLDGRVFERHSKPLMTDGKISGRVWSFHDISQRKQAEKVAEAAKERLRRGQMYANIGTWEWNIVTGDLFWTEQIAPLFGYPQGDLETSYENFLGAVHPEDRQAVVQAVADCIERDTPYEIEHRVIWPDGTVRWLLERGAVQRDSEGHPQRMIGVVQDIDDRKRAEKALEERESLLLEAQQLASLGNWSADLVTGELIWSDEIYRIFGHEPGSICPTVASSHEAIHPEDKALVEKLELLAKKGGRLDVIHRILRPDNTVRHVHELADVHFSADGQPVRMSGTVQDVTERIEAEQRLRDTEQRFAFAVEGAGDGVWDWDMSTGRMLLSPRYEEMLGYNQGEIEPTLDEWTMSVHPSDLADVQTSLQDYLQGRNPAYAVELRLRRKDGSYKWVLCRGTVVTRSSEGTPLRMIGIHTDISERKKAELELVSAREAADRANQAKSEFLSSMSHELRTPMHAILGFGQLMEYDETLPEEHKDSVKEILKAGHHLLQMINEVLDLAKVESGRIDLSIESVGLDSLLIECVSLVEPQAKNRNISIKISEMIGMAVKADRTRLKQVILNLLSNAVKYNRDNGSIHIAASSQAGQGDRLQIKVSDTGRGISEERINELFQPFNRLGAEQSEIEGTGIGLTITRRLIELMKGKIYVSSKLGIGSVFTIDLPRDVIESQDSVLTGSATSQSSFDKNNISTENTVLYIEDNPANIKLVKQILKQVTDIHLITAHTPDLGIELAFANRPSLILLDINMPGMDGYQLLKIFKTETSLKEIPVVALTANAMPRDIERGLSSGFIEYLTKPFDIVKFLAAIKSALANKKQKTP